MSRGKTVRAPGGGGTPPGGAEQCAAGIAPTPCCIYNQLCTFEVERCRYAWPPLRQSHASLPSPTLPLALPPCSCPACPPPAWPTTWQPQPQQLQQRRAAARWWPPHPLQPATKHFHRVHTATSLQVGGRAGGWVGGWVQGMGIQQAAKDGSAAAAAAVTHIPAANTPLCLPPPSEHPDIVMTRAVDEDFLHKFEAGEGSRLLPLLRLLCLHLVAAGCRRSARVGGESEGGDRLLSKSRAGTRSDASGGRCVAMLKPDAPPSLPPPHPTPPHPKRLQRLQERRLGDGTHRAGGHG